MKNEWTIKQADIESTGNISRIIGCTPVTAGILATRGISTPEEAYGFLNPSLETIRSPFLIKDMEAGVKRISDAIMKKEKILVFGDYDADGVTGTTILYDFLLYACADVSYYIPHRIDEGYSFRSIHIEKVLVPRKAGLVITVDCGSDSAEAVAAASELGIDVIITDHHTVPEPPPLAYALINPKRPDCTSEMEHLAGVGVVFYLLIALRKHLRDLNFWVSKPEPNLKALCDLVAIGTVADIVPLVHENRVLTKTGIDIINDSPRTGLKSLITASRINKEHLSETDIAFKLAPRINAAGRLDHADLAVNLLQADCTKKGKSIARSLNELNTKRQKIEQNMFDEILTHFSEKTDSQDQKALVLFRKGWHLGVLGIVASKLVNHYFKPVVLISLEEDSGKGSGRSVPGINLYNALSACSATLSGYGGHSMAAGLSVKTKNLKQFVTEFNSHISGITPEKGFTQNISIDSRLCFDDITPRLIDELEKLQPFGCDNPEPLFISDSVTIVSSSIVGNCHRRLVLKSEKSQTDASFLAMHFNIDAEKPYPDFFNHLVYKLRWNRWNNSKSPQIIIEDFC